MIPMLGSVGSLYDIHLDSVSPQCINETDKIDITYLHYLLTYLLT